MNKLAEYDRCGWGMSSGCKEHFTELDDVVLVMDATTPVDHCDNGHRMYHRFCLPVGTRPLPRIGIFGLLPERQLTVV